MSKSTNMLSILWLLRSGRRMTAQQLADELEIHIRTVYRCIDALCATGVPIVADSGPGGGYRVLERFADSPLLFDGEEQKALLHASAFAEEAGYPFGEALARAVDKLKRYANAMQLERMERHRDGLTVIHPPVDERQRELLRVLEEAGAEGRSVRMAYDKGRGEGPTEREYDPYGIVHWKGAWYTVGYCGLRGQLRSFRVDRIVRLESSERRFARPPEFSAKAHLMGELLPGALDADALTRVVLQGNDMVLDMLSQHWLFGHALVSREPGQAEYRIGTSALQTYVPYFLLPYGKTLTIREPAALVERLADVCSELTEHYRTMMKEQGSDTNER